MKILRAAHLGWCFGVRNAVALVTDLARHRPVTLLGELVHNDSVNEALRAQGVQVCHRVEEIATDTVLISAHGASSTTLEQARRRARNVFEATCPLVHAAHRAVGELVAAGYHPVIIGQRHHVEVRGLTGDLVEYDVVLSYDDVLRLACRPRIGLVAQTTQPVERVHRLRDLIRQQFPGSEVRFVDTVCQPTKLRQAAAVQLARQCDVVVVIGGRHSNNTNQLAQACIRQGTPVVRIESAAELPPGAFAGTETVGLTAGTSTPDALIVEVEQWLKQLAQETHEEETEPDDDRALARSVGESRPASAATRTLD